MYKKSRTKRQELKANHKKHHPNSVPTPKSLPWNVYVKEIRKKLTLKQNEHILDDSLYCCWEENWGVEETICECEDAFENNYKLRC